MTSILIENCAAIVASAHSPVLWGHDILCENGAITAIGTELRKSAPEGVEIINGDGMFVYPGLVNTHHHFFQCFVRNRAELDWTRYSVIEWLDLLETDRGLLLSQFSCGDGGTDQTRLHDGL